ncbi:MAG: formylglycine-generating enzyme family protein, partial [Caldilineaceae bacterium]
FVRNQSPYGAVNMSGNVHEWVQDFYLDDYYEWSPYRDPLNTISQRLPYYSARGGDYRPNWWYSRTTNRNAGHHGDEDGPNDRPLFRSFRVGFRCARSLTGDPASLQLPPTEE